MTLEMIDGIEFMAEADPPQYILDLSDASIRSGIKLRKHKPAEA